MLLVACIDGVTEMTFYVTASLEASLVFLLQRCITSANDQCVIF